LPGLWCHPPSRSYKYSVPSLYGEIKIGIGAGLTSESEVPPFLRIRVEAVFHHKGSQEQPTSTFFKEVLFHDIGILLCFGFCVIEIGGPPDEVVHRSLGSVGIKDLYPEPERQKLILNVFQRHRSLSLCRYPRAFK
jgi:hypothetical protein